MNNKGVGFFMVRDGIFKDLEILYTLNDCGGLVVSGDRLWIGTENDVDDGVGEG